MGSLAKRLGLGIVVAYSCLHFFESGIGGLATPPEDRCRGDFLSAFPGPFVRRYNPALAEQFYTLADLQVGQGREGAAGVWNYGPVFHAATLPLTALPGRGIACSAWMLANGVFVALAAWWIFGALVPPGVPRRGTLAVVYACLWLNFFPLLEAFRQGNIELFELFLIVAAYRWLARGAPEPRSGRRTEIGAGVLLGAAAMTKFLPVIFFPYLALKRRWRVLIAWLATVAVIAGAAEWLLGWRHSYTMALFDPLEGYSAYTYHQGLTSLVLRLFGRYREGFTGIGEAVIPPDRVGAALLTVRAALAAAMLAFAALFALRRRVSNLHLEFALLCAFMIFVPPWSWNYYQVFLLLPFSVLLKAVWGSSRRRAVGWAGLGVLYVSTASVVVPARVLDWLGDWGPSGSLQVMHNLSLPAWANLGTLLVLGVMYWRAGSRPRPGLAPATRPFAVEARA